MKEGETSWAKKLASNWLWMWHAKLLATCVGIRLFFVAYFWVLKHPIGTVYVMPETWVDRWIGFQPWAIWLYLSLWFYVGALPAFYGNMRELRVYTLFSSLLGAIGLSVFYVWPTMVRIQVLPEGAGDWMRLLKTVDAAGNACPSLHVGYAVFTAFGISELLKRVAAPSLLQWCNLLWCLGIWYSTIAIQQHVFYDGIAGALLGTVFGIGLCRSLSSSRNSGT